MDQAEHLRKLNGWQFPASPSSPEGRRIMDPLSLPALAAEPQATQQTCHQWLPHLPTHTHFTCKYKAVEITLWKWFDPLSLRIYIFYNPFFMSSNSYLIPFSPFHQLCMTGERADRNRAQMWACREGSGRLHNRATWGTNAIQDSTGVLNLGLLRFYKTTQSTLRPLPFEIMLPI